MKTIVSLCLVLLSGAAAAAHSAPACDRECLRGAVTRYLYALLKHDTSKLPLADNLRVTEDGVEKPLAKVGILNTITSLRGYRQDVIDERAGVAFAGRRLREASSVTAGSRGVRADGTRPVGRG